MAVVGAIPRDEFNRSLTRQSSTDALIPYSSIFIDDTFCLFSCLLKDRDKTKKYTDFTVKIKEKEIKCHRFVLNACSVYFETLFQSNPKECQDRFITIEIIEPEIFELINDVFYYGSVEFSTENMKEVWEAVHILKVEFLVPLVENFITEHITEENIFNIYNLSKEISTQNFISQLLSCIKDNFYSLHKSGNLWQLDFVDFKNIFENHKPELCANCKVKCIMTWCGTNLEGNKPPLNEKNLQYIADMLERVNLENASQELLNKLMLNPFVILDQRAILFVNKNVAEQNRILKSMKLRRTRPFDIRISSCPCNKQYRPLTAVSDSRRKTFIVGGQILKLLNQENNRNKFCDVIVIVDDIVFTCHKFVLCACSELFENIFEAAIVSSVPLKDHGITVCAEDFRIILQNIYGRCETFNSQNLAGIWETSITLKISFLVDKCEKLASSLVTASNCHEFYRLAEVLNSDNVLNDIKNFVVGNYKDVVKSETFSSLPYDLVHHLIVTPKSPQTSSDTLVNIILTWCHAIKPESKGNDNLKHLGNLMENVNLNNLSRDCKKAVLKNQYIQGNQVVIKLLCSIIADLI